MRVIHWPWLEETPPTRWNHNTGVHDNGESYEEGGEEAGEEGGEEAGGQEEGREEVSMHRPASAGTPAYSP